MSSCAPSGLARNIARPSVAELPGPAGGDAAAPEPIPIPRTPPDITIFFHIPKTGGTTMDGILARRFPGPEHFDGRVGTTMSAISLRPREKIEAKYRALPVADRDAIRCVMGTHYPMGIDTMLSRPAKYFTVLRDPVERAASHFFDVRTQPHYPAHARLRDMSLDDFLDSGLGLAAHDTQVRYLSGCPELDSDWDRHGRPITPVPVERRHLELAKRNIEAHFITAAPLPQFDSLLMLLRRIYGWRLDQVLYVRHNVGASRAAGVEPISDHTRRRLAETNRYDIELYAWACARFAAQIAPLEPGISRDLRRFELLNGIAGGVRRALPRAASWQEARRLFSAAS